MDARDAHQQLADLSLPAIARQQITVALGVIGHVNSVLHDLDLELERYAPREVPATARTHDRSPLKRITAFADDRPPSRKCHARRDSASVGLARSTHRS